MAEIIDFFRENMQITQHAFDLCAALMKYLFEKYTIVPHDIILAAEPCLRMMRDRALQAIENYNENEVPP